MVEAVIAGAGVEAVAVVEEVVVHHHTCLQTLSKKERKEFEPHAVVDGPRLKTDY
jgi:hypothetical protein